MKSVLTVFCLVIFSAALRAQIGFSSWQNGYLYVSAYTGATNPEAFNLTFAGNGSINVPNWRLSVKLKGPVSGFLNLYSIPAEKLVLRPVSVTGQGSSAIPGISAIGIPPAVNLIQGTEVFLVPQSNAPLYNQPVSPLGYYNLQMKFSLTVAGGAYLGAYPLWSSYDAPLEFTAYDQYNNIIGRTQHNFTIQIGWITGTPPVAEQMTLQVSPQAANAALEFKTIQNYRNGVSVTNPSGLTVSSNTNYQIKVRALQSSFSSAAGSSLPLSAVTLSLASSTAVMGTSYPVSLSNVSQLVAKGNSSSGQKVYYDLTYATAPNDQRFINAKMEDYSTTLQFEILAQ